MRLRCQSLVTPVVLAALLAACEAEEGSGASDGSATPDGASGDDALASKANPEAPEADAPPVNQSEPAAADCGADELGRWLNVLPTDTVKEEIAATVGDRPIRYIEPGGVVTMDLRPERLNVEMGADGRIKLFRCG